MEVCQGTSWFSMLMHSSQDTKCERQRRKADRRQKGLEGAVEEGGENGGRLREEERVEVRIVKSVAEHESCECPRKYARRKCYKLTFNVHALFTLGGRNLYMKQQA